MGHRLSATKRQHNDVWLPTDDKSHTPYPSAGRSRFDRHFGTLPLFSFPSLVEPNSNVSEYATYVHLAASDETVVSPGVEQNTSRGVSHTVKSVSAFVVLLCLK
jgi:hypothetical protein